MLRDSFLVGTYCQATEPGIYGFRMEENTGKIIKSFELTGVSNPSYLTISEDGRFIYCVSEEMTFNGQPGGGVAAWKREGETYRLLNQTGSGGTLPCYILLDEKRSLLFTANYGSGSVSMFTLAEDGSINRLRDLQQHEGHGVNPERQEGPHVHFLQFSADYKGIWSVDLGLDAIKYYEIDEKNACLRPCEERDIHLPAGVGPRHIAVHPQYPQIWYVACELSSEVIVIEVKETGSKILQQLSTLAHDNPNNTAAAVKLSSDGKYLYVSNRGSDNIAVFEVSSDGRQISKIENADAGGQVPRDITLWNDYLLAANQSSDGISVLCVEKSTGKLKNSGIMIDCPCPVCIV